MSVGQPADKFGGDKISRKHRTSPVKVFSNVRCALGEGPAWDVESQSLFWVDIHGSKVFVAAADGVVKDSWNILEQPSAVILMRSGIVLVPAGQEILSLCTESGELRSVAHLSGERGH